MHLEMLRKTREPEVPPVLVANQTSDIVYALLSIPSVVLPLPAELEVRPWGIPWLPI
jgi:hypothetical protein